MPPPVPDQVCSDLVVLREFSEVPSTPTTVGIMVGQLTAVPQLPVAAKQEASTAHCSVSRERSQLGDCVRRLLVFWLDARGRVQLPRPSACSDSRSQPWRAKSREKAASVAHSTYCTAAKGMTYFLLHGSAHKVALSQINY